MNITTLTKEIPIEKLIKDYLDVQRFDACCAKCENYGKNWACPPFDFDPEELISRYGSILLYAKKAEPECDRVFASDAELKDAWEELLFPVDEALRRELLELEKACPESLALFSGGCNECETCTREKGLPCVRPELRRCSPEALGCDVLKIMDEVFGETAEWAANGRLPKKYLLLGGLLKKV